MSRQQERCGSTSTNTQPALSRVYCGIPDNTRHLPNISLKLAHRLRRWANVKLTLGECLVLSEMSRDTLGTFRGDTRGRHVTSRVYNPARGGGPRVVVSTAAFHARVRGSVPGLGGLKETKLFLPHPRVKVSIVGSLRDREVACSASDRQCSNFEFCVWRTVSSQSSHHPQEVLLAQFSLYVHKGGLKPDSFHFHFNPAHISKHGTF